MEKLWKPFPQLSKEIITFVYPKIGKLKWRTISTASLWPTVIKGEKVVEWETLVSDAQKGSVKGINLELLGFKPEKGKITSKTFVSEKASETERDSQVFGMHFNEVLREWGSKLRCVQGMKEPIIVCSPEIQKIDKILKKPEDYWKFREKVIDRFEEELRNFREKLTKIA